MAVPRLTARGRLELATATKEVIRAADDEAAKRGHADVTVEHLVWALLFDDTVRAVFQVAGVDVDALDESLDAYFDAKLPAFSTPDAVASDPHFVRVLERAGSDARSRKCKTVSVFDLLGAVCRDLRSPSWALLADQDVAPVDILVAMSHGLSKADAFAKTCPAVSRRKGAEWTVTFHDDKYTTKAFVVAVLLEVFGLSEAQAIETMRRVDEAGIAVVGSYLRDVAEAKAARTLSLARKEGMPLLVVVDCPVGTYR